MNAAESNPRCPATMPLRESAAALAKAVRDRLSAGHHLGFGMLRATLQVERSLEADAESAESLAREAHIRACSLAHEALLLACRQFLTSVGRLGGPPEPGAMAPAVEAMAEIVRLHDRRAAAPQ